MEEERSLPAECAGGFGQSPPAHCARPRLCLVGGTATDVGLRLARGEQGFAHAHFVSAFARARARHTDTAKSVCLSSSLLGWRPTAAYAAAAILVFECELAAPTACGVPNPVVLIIRGDDRERPSLSVSLSCGLRVVVTPLSPPLTAAAEELRKLFAGSGGLGLSPRLRTVHRKVGLLRRKSGQRWCASP